MFSLFLKLPLHNKHTFDHFFHKLYKFMNKNHITLLPLLAFCSPFMTINIPSSSHPFPLFLFRKIYILWLTTNSQSITRVILSFIRGLYTYTHTHTKTLFNYMINLSIHSLSSSTFTILQTSTPIPKSYKYKFLFAPNDKNVNNFLLCQAIMLPPPSAFCFSFYIYFLYLFFN